ncbi:hypothetical protein [Bifidobacterium sp. ESL0732]|uniref:hypothetical protein n=1 Tax=Bifidobacterium sp. ESL0732 TaxID=2983222 RepID=UPI0023F78ED6|nr:hypothetical protein [Bifidobacterium sp. ESL0732]WEV63930.1 hypothetical protein OZX70_08410 [Bifidobacterium sp. ESL0732]
MNSTSAKRKFKGRVVLVVTLVAALIAGISTAAYGAYVKSKSVAVTSPEENFTTGAGVQGEYALDTQIAKDKSGNIWIWGYYNLCNIDNAGQGGYFSGGKNGASYTGDPKASGSCTGITNNNKPSVIRGFTCATDVAGSAYALMAVDCYGNLYGWGDNTQNGSRVPSDPAFIASGGPATNVTGGVYGLYKNQTGASEAIPDTVNQANPQASSETWKPIDGPGAPTGTYPDGDDTSKVVKVASNEYGFAWLKEDGTVWTVGDNAFGARGAGKWGDTPAKWGREGTDGYPVGTSSGVALSPTKVTFPGNVKIKSVYSGYNTFFAVDTNNQVYFWGKSFGGGAAMSNEELEAYSSSDTTKPCRSLSGSNYYCFSPVPVPSLTKLIADNGGYIKLLGGFSYGAMLTSNKKLWTWGVSTDGIGMPESDKQNDSTYRSTPQVLSATTADGSTVTADNVIDANGGYHSGQFVTEDGYAWGWGQHKWGGAFSSNMSPTEDATPTNDKDRPGIVWNPTKDPQHRKAVKVGGNKDGANLNLNDGSVYTWGENGGGTSLGGQGYGTQTVCAYGQPGCVSPKVMATQGKRAQSGLFVWPATFVPEVQNVGSYQTVIKNAYPFQTTPVHNGDEVKYTVQVRNELSSFNNPTVKIEDTWGPNAALVAGSFSAKYAASNSQDTDTDISDKFSLSSTGYSTKDPSMQLDPLSVIAITYRVKVTGATGNVGGAVILSNTGGAGGQIDSDETFNPIE